VLYHSRNGVTVRQPEVHDIGSTGEATLFELAYVSRAVHLMDEPALDTLLRSARHRNQELGVTGMLLYRSQSFVQVLEGPEQNVCEVFARIREDQRHFRVRTLLERPTATRKFPNWSMGFRRLDGNNAPDGYHGFLEGEVLDLTDRAESDLVELLYVFRAQA